MRKRFPASGPNPLSRHGKHKPGYKYPSKSTGGRQLSQFDKGSFCCWDGEGVGSHPHRYIMLMNNRDVLPPLMDAKGLHTKVCLEYLCKTARLLPQNTIHVIFGGSYDTNMMLGDIPKRLIKQLWETKHVRWLNFEIDYRQRKELTIRMLSEDKTQWYTKRANGTWKKNVLASITLWDVHGFFQSSFMRAIQDNLKDVNIDEITTIEEHKKDRANFSAKQMDDIARYCRLECDYLEKLMLDMHSNLQRADSDNNGNEKPLVINRWDGAGSIAAAYLKRYHVKVHMSGNSRVKERATNTPIEEPVKSWAEYAYAGGRIEQFKFGHAQQRVYQYDIISAYPSAMLELPSLARGEWVYTRHFNANQYGLWDCEYNYETHKKGRYHNPLVLPFFFRNHKNAICFPLKGRGKYWTPEVTAAIKWKPDQTKIHGGWVWKPVDDTKPFAFVADIFKRRQWMKENGIGAQKILKLGLNSLYGKTAQQRGYTPSGDNEEPLIPYFQLEWAGYITSYTRAKLFSVAISKPESIISIMTDGIMATEPLDVPLGKNLGDFEESSEIEDYIGVKAGVYFTKYKGKDWKDTYRGYDPGQLHRERILEAWSQRQSALYAVSSRFITMGSALSGENMWRKWRSWQTDERELCLWFRDTKRISSTPREWNKRANNPATSLQQTFPHIYMSGERRLEEGFNPLADIDHSCKYVRKWGTSEEDKGDHNVPVSLIEQEEEDSYL